MDTGRLPADNDKNNDNSCGFIKNDFTNVENAYNNLVDSYWKFQTKSFNFCIRGLVFRHFRSESEDMVYKKFRN